MSDEAVQDDAADTEDLDTASDGEPAASFNLKASPNVAVVLVVAIFLLFALVLPTCGGCFEVGPSVLYGVAHRLATTRTSTATR